MDGFPNQGSEPRKPSPGEIEVKQASFLLMVFRWLGVPMPKDGDPAAVERTGVLLSRWIRGEARKAHVDGA